MIKRDLMHASLRHRTGIRALPDKAGWRITLDRITSRWNRQDEDMTMRSEQENRLLYASRR